VCLEWFVYVMVCVCRGLFIVVFWCVFVVVCLVSRWWFVYCSGMVWVCGGLFRGVLWCVFVVVWCGFVVVCFVECYGVSLL